MKTIWKLSLKGDRTEVCVPAGAHMLTAQMLDGCPTVWAMVDLEAPPVNLALVCYGTADDLPEDPGYCVGTMQDGGVARHVFVEAV